MFFQHNPLRAQHDRIHWGHLSSPDLVAWTEHPVAFGPSADGPDALGCWSGVWVPGTQPAVMAYTGIANTAADSTICVRTALDDELLTWSEPRLAATTPTGAGIAEMRDPYVFEWSGRRWALLGAGKQDETPAVLLYSCDDLDDWHYEGIWLTADDPILGAVGRAQIWECPQLVPVDGGYVLLLSFITDQAAGDVVYASGDLVGRDGRPAFEVHSAGLADNSRDMYAPQVVPDDAGPLFFGWVKQDAAPDDAPSDAQVGCLTLPRRLRLTAGRLAVDPDPALESLLGPATAIAADLAFAPVPLPPAARVTVHPVGMPVAHLRLVAPGVDVNLTVGQAGADIWVDADVVEAYPRGGVPTTVRAAASGQWRLEGTALIDLTIAEVVPTA